MHPMQEDVSKVHIFSIWFSVYMPRGDRKPWSLVNVRPLFVGADRLEDGVLPRESFRAAAQAAAEGQKMLVGDWSMAKQKPDRSWRVFCRCKVHEIC